MADVVSCSSLHDTVGRGSDCGSDWGRCRLRIKGTFIDVSSDNGSLSPRASSDPGSVTHGVGAGTERDKEEQYIGELSEHLNFMWSSSQAGDTASNAGSQNSLPLDDQLKEMMPLLPPSTTKTSDLRSHIKFAAREMEKSLHQRRRRAVLCAIQEIPDQVGDVLQRSAMGIVDDLIGEVAVVKDMIEGEATAREQTGINTAVRKLEVIPEMIQDSFEAHFSRAEQTVRARVDGMIQNFEASHIANDQVVQEMRAIPAEVQEIAKQAMQAAVVESRVQAQMQIDCALASLPNSGAKLLAGVAEELIIPQVPGYSTEMVRNAKNAVVGTVEHLCAVVEKEENEMPGVTNQLVAETLLRAKVENNAESDKKDEPPPALFLSVNEGSCGHPELCARPCLYFAKGECTNGLNCNFCHLDHPRRPVHPDKKNRQLLKDMPFAECVAVLAPILHDKVAELGLGQEVLETMDSFMTSLYGGAMSVQDPELQQGGRRKRQLQEFLRSMTLRSVLALLMRAAPSASQREAVDQFTTRLRMASDRRRF